MIKRINLRGISRTPSDRASEDGGCAESLNVRIDGGETAPAINASFINNTVDERGKRMFPGEDEEFPAPWEVVYLHKTDAYQRAILTYGEDDHYNICIYNDTDDPDASEFTILASFEDEPLKSVSSIGNLLLIITEKRTVRLLFKDGEYHNLGDSLPFPSIIIGEHLNSGQQTIRNYDIPPASSLVDSVYELDDAIWNVKTYNPEIDNVAAMNQAENFAEQLRGQIIETDAANPGYAYPVFAKYSLVLYDGSEIASDAFLLYPSAMPLASIDIQSNFTTRKCQATFVKSYYDIVAYAKDNDEIQNLINNYSDIVSSIRFYITEDITPGIPDTHTRAMATVTSEQPNLIEGTILMENGMTRDDLESVGNFYLLKQVELSDIMSSTTLPFYNNTDRVARTRLVTSAYNARNYITGGVASNYNSRLLLADAKEKLNAGVGTFPGYQEFGEKTTWESIQFYYVVSDNTGLNAVVEGPVIENVESVTLEDGLLASYVTYNNVNCKKVIAVLKDSGGYHYFRIAMREHPLIDMSYFISLEYMGFADTLQKVDQGTLDVDGITAVPGIPEEIQSLSPESGTVGRANRVYLSSFSNPFVFEQSQQFSDKVIGIAPLTKPLSTGQVGQFALYVFTLGGIYSIGISNAGEFVNHVLVSRDVCRYPSTITLLDQAIVYLTDKGLMLLTGGDITDLSKEMNGRHYVLEPEVGDMLESTEWGNLVPGILGDTATFMKFMQDAEIGYDYAGARLICFNKEKVYAYVYELPYGAWHKISVGAAGRTAWRTVNAYPSLWANEVTHNEYYDYKTKVLDYSTFLDVSYIGSTLGMIVTRPMDMEEPDVRKVIKSIRIRGAYNKEDVKYILLGSMDGMRFGVLHSLHGGSFKWFRLVILTNLQPNERLTWVEVDYDERFNNRLR